MNNTEPWPWCQQVQDEGKGFPDVSLLDINPFCMLDFNLDGDHDHISSVDYPPTVPSASCDDDNINARSISCWADANAPTDPYSIAPEPSLDVEDDMMHFARFASTVGMPTPVSSLTQGYTIPGSGNFDPDASVVGEPVDLSPAGCSGGLCCVDVDKAANSPLSPFTIESPTNTLLPNTACDAPYQPTDSRSPPSVQVIKSKPAPKSSKQKRKRGRPRLFTLPDETDNPSELGSSLAPTGAPCLPHHTTGKPLRASLSSDRAGRQKARERNRKAAIRYRNKMESLSEKLEEEVQTLLTQRRTLTACRDDLLNDVFDLKHMLLQTTGNDTAIQAYFQSELRRAYGHLATDPNSTIGNIIGLGIGAQWCHLRLG